LQIDRLPLLLSASRLALGPCFAIFALRLGAEGFAGHADTALRAGPLAIALFAAASDFLDGRLARRLGVATRRGAALDVAADAAFLLCALAALARVGVIPFVLPVAATVSLAAFARRWPVVARDDTLASGLGDASVARPAHRAPADALGHAAGILNYAVVLAASAAPFLVFPRTLIGGAAIAVAILNLAPLLLRRFRARSPS
jgi:cardiolipin synthase (CMP-forming)